MSAPINMAKENHFVVIFLIFVVISIISVSDGDVPRPRGVSRSSMNIFRLI